VIDREQLVAALERLDPREREVLDLSLRRRVPDDAMAQVYGLDAAEVARRRTAAIERLSEDLGIQRGADLGHMLQALLEPETWENVILTDPEPLEAEDGEEPLEEEPVEPEPAEPEDAIETRPVSELEAEPVTESEAEAPEPELHEPSEELHEPPHEPSAEPVLEMLGEHRLSDGSGSGSKRRRLTAALAAAATVLLPAAGIVAASTLGDESNDDGDRAESRARHFFPSAEGPLAQPFASDPEAVSGYTIARVRRPAALRAAPGGKVKLRIRPRTEWGSARIMGVVRQRGEWLAVQVPELDNGQVGWLRASDAELGTVPWSLHVDLSNRQLIVRKDGHFVRRVTVAIGSPEHPTPEGRFSVTDKLKVGDEGSPYGCCVLALSGHQTRLPSGWPGGDRLAVHATSDLTSIGQPVSLGCMRAASDQARWLIQKIPLGAPLFVRA
jgi:L,D-transpeptidase catalytic domain